FPVFIYEVEGGKLEKSVFMVQGQNAIVVQYEMCALPDGWTSVPIELEIRPLIAFRDYHGTTHENSALNPNVEIENGLMTLRPYGDLPPLHFAHDSAEIDRAGFWYRNFQYSIEQERGLDFEEDLFSPCAFTFDLTKKGKVSVIASTHRLE